MKAPLPKNESERLRTLRDLAVLDTPPEAAFDDITGLAALVCGTPIALVTLIDEHRQWFKSCKGLSISETPRDLAFCAHSILQSEMLIVVDATKDPRFADNPMVTGEPHIRFYAGAPLVAADSSVVGTLAVIDQAPRQLSDDQAEALCALSRQVMRQLELRRQLLKQNRRTWEIHAIQDALLDSALDCIIGMDGNGRVVEFNPAAERTFGYTRDEAMGRELADLIVPPSLRELHRADLAKYLAGGEAPILNRRLEMAAVCKDGTELTVELAVVRAGKSEPSLFIGFLRDITERQMVQRNLQATEQRYFRQREAVTRLMQHETFFHGDLPGILQQVAATAADTLGVERVSVWRFDRKDAHIRVVSLFDLEAKSRSFEAELPLASYPEYFEALADGEVMAVDDALHDPRTSGLVEGYIRPRGITSILDVPIHKEGVVDGFLRQEHIGPPRQWTTDEKTFAVTMANLVSLAMEVAERRRAEAEARRNQERFDILARATSDVVWDWNLQTDAVWRNENFQALSGYGPAEITPNSEFWSESIHPDDVKRIKDGIERVFDSGQQHWSDEYRFRCKNGSYSDIFDRGYVVHDAAGKPVRMMGVMMNLTQQKQAAVALRESEERFFKAFHATPAAIAISTQAEGRYVDVNDFFLDMFGYRREEVIGRKALELGVWARPEERATIIQTLREGREVRNVPCLFRPKSGGLRNALVSVESINLGGDACLLFICHDITIAKQASESLSVKSEILTAVTESLAAYVERGDWKEAFGRLLRCALTQTQSEYGFIGVVVGGQKLRVLAYEGIVWDAVANRDFYEQAMRGYRENGYLEFTNLDNLFGRTVTTGRVIIANQPDVDPRSSGRPAGHPPMHSFLGVPIGNGQKINGVVALANRSGGYSDVEKDSIETLVRQAGGLCEGYLQREASLFLEREREKAEAALRQSEERLRLAVGAANLGLWDWDLVTNQVVFSREWKAQLGYQEHEIENEFREWESRVHPDDLSFALERIQQYRADPKGALEMEFRMRHKDGFWLWIYTRGEILRNADGQPVRMLGGHIDITKRKRAEQDLHESETRLHAVWETAHDAMRLLDEHGIIVAVNAAFCRMFEMQREQLEGHPFTVTYSGQRDRKELERRFRERFLARQVRLQEERQMTLHNGRTVELEIASTFIDLAGHGTLLLGLFRDITERKQLEEQLRQSQKMESIGLLAGGVAHDFNNILTVIQGHVSLLTMSEQISSEAADSAQQIASAAERAINLTRQLLAFGRKQVMQPRHLDLNRIVGEMIKMLQRLLGDDITLQLEPAANLPTIRADAGMIEQVLMNLSVNARDAMPKGGKLLIRTAVKEVNEAFVRLNPEATPGRFVCLMVGDTGSGISPENMPHIFEPFFTTKDVGKGTGLGLATVYGIVKQHHGWIRVQSEVGVGTKFQIYLPVNEDHEKVAQPLASQKAVAGGTETLLVVEDDVNVRRLNKLILEPFGYVVLEASDGLGALELWQEHHERIHLVLTDMVMPGGLSGRDLAAKLLSQKPSTKIIFTSGYSVDVFGKEMKLEDGINFLQKPYSPEKLAEVVRHCLNGQ